MSQEATGQPALNVNIEQPDIDWGEMEAKIEAKVQEGLKQFRDEIERVWHEKAQAQLNTTSAEYLAGLTITATSVGVEGTITGFRPVAIEQGIKRFDMKPGLLKGFPYRVIPMRDGGFRTVSKTSPEGSWWHPGTQAAAIGEQVKAEAPKIAGKIFTKLIERMEV